MQQNKILLKDILFNRAKVEKIAGEIKAVYPDFKAEKFVVAVLEKFPDLELKARIRWITECLKRYLAADYVAAASVLIEALPPPNDPTLSDNDFGDFIYAPYADFVALYGCSKAHLSFSLNALKAMTMRFSAEDAIRYFINTFPKETLSQMLHWASDEHYHVRRLSCEGSRPKLPWAQKIGLQPEQAIPILDKLFCDRTRFVTRSVANHLNDISKLNPELVLSTLARWKKLDKQNSQEMGFIIRHSLRTLVKKGHPDTLRFLNVSPEPEVDLIAFDLVQDSVKIGNALEFLILLKALKTERLVIDYVIYFQNQAGQLKNKKVFKLKQLDIQKNQVLTFKKSHPFKRMTTRALYAGEHALEIQVNGQKMGLKTFFLNLI